MLEQNPLKVGLKKKLISIVVENFSLVYAHFGNLFVLKDIIKDG